MVEQFRNDTGHGIDIPRFGIYVPAGAAFTVPDEDNGSLNDDPGLTNLGTSGTTVVSVTDQGDGTFTVTGTTATDAGNGTFTTTGTVTDNGDGTFTLAA